MMSYDNDSVHVSEADEEQIGRDEKEEEQQEIDIGTTTKKRIKLDYNSISKTKLKELCRIW